jgi:hypothetical protein
MHDGILRVVGFTLLQGGAALADAAMALRADGAGVSRFVAEVQRWLRQDHRLIEASSARPLQHAYFVKVDVATMRVREVLFDGSDDR